MSADTFYVTNDVRFGRLAALEVYLNLPTGTVAYYDGNEAAVVATGFVMSNGINRSLNRKYVITKHEWSFSKTRLWLGLWFRLLRLRL